MCGENKNNNELFIIKNNMTKLFLLLFFDITWCWWQNKTRWCLVSCWWVIMKSQGRSGKWKGNPQELKGYLTLVKNVSFSWGKATTWARCCLSYCCCLYTYLNHSFLLKSLSMPDRQHLSSNSWDGSDHTCRDIAPPGDKFWHLHYNFPVYFPTWWCWCCCCSLICSCWA